GGRGGLVGGGGTPGGGGARVYDDEARRVGWKTEKDGKEHQSRLEEDRLRELAKAGGGDGHYFRIDLGLGAVVPALAKLKEGNLEQRTEAVPVEAYPGLLFPAVMLLLVEAGLSRPQPG